ncbi:MAG: hypothetical protein Q8L41_01425 [Anaerolineales bacterium]|nr:hypothetical protein [Anaerolineales bacterium]
MTSLLSPYLGNLPDPILQALETEFSEIEMRFAKRDWNPLELSCARFAEAVLRYLEWKESGGNFTPIGIQLQRQSIVNQVRNNANMPDELRFLVLKSVELLLDIRNRRNVAHLASVVNVDEMDGRLTLVLAKWVLSELIRGEASLDPKVVQGIIDGLSVKEIPLIDEIDGDLVFLETHLIDAGDRILVTLYHQYPKAIDLSTLRRAVRYKNSTLFRDNLISKLHDEGKVYLKGENIFLTSKGIAWVENYVQMKFQAIK